MLEVAPEAQVTAVNFYFRHESGFDMLETLVFREDRQDRAEKVVFTMAAYDLDTAYSGLCHATSRAAWRALQNYGKPEIYH